MGHVDALLVNLPADTRLDKATLLVSPLDTLRCERGRNAINGIEHFFTGGHGNRTFECMWTHFAMELCFEGDIVAILERNNSDVRLVRRRLHSYEFATETFIPFHTVTVGDVLHFYSTKCATSYNFVWRNCKHFAYDFTAKVLLQRSIGTFGTWCRPFEDQWKNRTQNEGWQKHNSSLYAGLVLVSGSMSGLSSAAIATKK